MTSDEAVLRLKQHVTWARRGTRAGQDAHTLHDALLALVEEHRHVIFEVRDVMTQLNRVRKRAPADMKDEELVASIEALLRMRLDLTVFKTLNAAAPLSTSEIQAVRAKQG